MPSEQVSLYSGLSERAILKCQECFGLIKRERRNSIERNYQVNALGL